MQCPYMPEHDKPPGGSWPHMADNGYPRHAMVTHSGTWPPIAAHGRTWPHMKGGGVVGGVGDGGGQGEGGVVDIRVGVREECRCGRRMTGHRRSV